MIEPNILSRVKREFQVSQLFRESAAGSQGADPASQRSDSPLSEEAFLDNLIEFLEREVASTQDSNQAA